MGPQRAASAYGLTFWGAPFPDRFVPSPPEWPLWHVQTDIADTQPPESWSDDEAVFHMQPAGAAVVERVAERTRLILPATPDPEAYAHPLLGFTAITNAAWRGWPSFHAGAFVLDGKAWMVTGDVGAGKSSTLAWLALHGYDVVADDLCITPNGTVFAGPRCLDLREDAAAHFGVGDDVGVLGQRRRWRISLGDVQSSYPIGGWILPAWGEEPVVSRIPLTERLPMMAARRAVLRGTPDAVHLSPLLALPALIFSRPRDYSRIDEAMTFLLTQIRESGSARRR